MGDIPIFVAHDSADVWAHPELFQPAATDGRPEFVAGVPPDYFSATGQLWGNPLYRWDRMRGVGLRVVDRRASAPRSPLVDLVRLDHFRGFEAFWEVPGDAETAEHGRWVKGPGARALRGAARRRSATCPSSPRTSGVITPEVEALRERFGFPGMAILQFAFGGDPQGSTFIPHNFERELVAYTGTHDNDTTVGLVDGAGVGDAHAQRGGRGAERAFALEYLKQRRHASPLGLHPRAARLGGRHSRSCRCRTCSASAARRA